ncbi:hypothetical protein F2Q70_00003490 [Brassica cretica]|uniref:Uncharacterized protein n=1 Tax=Brassica cretica TaxID=69181 RepID=A0A8S9J5K3_BRACR|nr:hypothetical protein F2Q70_00003490 [Brassica cretica]
MERVRPSLHYAAKPALCGQVTSKSRLSCLFSWSLQPDCRNRTSKYERMNLGRELSSSYRVSSRDGRLQSGSRDEAEMDACSRGRELRLRRTRAVGALSDRVFASWNASKNNLGFFGIRVPKDQDGAVYCFCKCWRVCDRIDKRFALMDSSRQR